MRWPRVRESASSGKGVPRGSYVQQVALRHDQAGACRARLVRALRRHCELGYQRSRRLDGHGGRAKGRVAAVRRPSVPALTQLRSLRRLASPRLRAGVRPSLPSARRRGGRGRGLRCHHPLPRPLHGRRKGATAVLRPARNSCGPVRSILPVPRVPERDAGGLAHCGGTRLRRGGVRPSPRLRLPWSLVRKTLPRISAGFAGSLVPAPGLGPSGFYRAGGRAVGNAVLVHLAVGELGDARATREAGEATQGQLRLPPHRISARTRWAAARSVHSAHVQRLGRLGVSAPRGRRGSRVQR